MTEDELLVAARENVIHTYVGLGEAVPGSKISRYPGFLSISASLPLSFCNFALDLTLGETPTAVGPNIAELMSLANANRMFRVFSMPKDEPGNIHEILSGAGFRVQQELVQMVFRGKHQVGAAEMTECLSPSDRERAATFMVAQFFVRQDPTLRNAVIHATSKSTHRLLLIQNGATIHGGVMLSETDAAVGLYNLCVARGMRGRRLGREIVGRCIFHAQNIDKMLVLQSEYGLRDWYERLGFEQFGIVRAYSWPQS